MSYLYHLLIGKKDIINGSLFSVFSFVNQGISFVLLIILAKFILPDDYGRLSLFTTFVSLSGFFVAFQSSGYMSISYFQDEKDTFKENVTAIIELSFLSVFLLSIFLAFILMFTDVDFGFPSYLLWVALCISLCTSISNMLLEYVRIKEKVVHYGIISCSNAFLNFILAIFFVVFLSKGWLGRVYSQYICSIIFLLLTVFVFYRKKLLKHRGAILRYKNLILWGLPLIPHLASAWIRQGCDRYIINFYHSPEDVGLFSFALNLVSIITMIGSAFNATNSVSIYKILSDTTIMNKYSRLRKQSKEILMIYFISTILVVLIVTFLVPLALPKYSGAMPYFFILSFFGFLQCLYFLVCNYLFYYGKTKRLMLITFSTSILHLMLSLALTRYSLYSTCVIYILIHMLVVYLVYRESHCLLKKNLIQI